MVAPRIAHSFPFMFLMLLIFDFFFTLLTSTLGITLGVRLTILRYSIRKAVGLKSETMWPALPHRKSRLAVGMVLRSPPHSVITLPPPPFSYVTSLHLLYPPPSQFLFSFSTPLLLPTRTAVTLSPLRRP